MIRLAIGGLAFIFFLVSSLPTFAEPVQGQASKWSPECRQSRMADAPTCSVEVRLDHLNGKPFGSFSLAFEQNKKGEMVSILTGNPNVLLAAIRVDRENPVECRGLICPFPTPQARMIVSQLRKGNLLLINVLTVEGEFTFDADADSFRDALKKLGWK